MELITDSTPAPMNALSCGADGVVQSTHKMLAAMTMGAMLHVQGGSLDRRLRQRLAMVQSSSPSYPLMASLDLARRLRARRAQAPSRLALPPWRPSGEASRSRRASVAAAAAAGARRGHGSAAYTRQDPFKAVIYDRTGSLSGYALQRALEARGCVPEMSDGGASSYCLRWHRLGKMRITSYGLLCIL